MASMKIKRAAVEALKVVTAEELVRVSRSPKHPLHKEFLWDDLNKAAYKWQLDKAREIISSVRVIFTRKDVKISSVAYVRDPRQASNKQGFVKVVDLIDDESYAQECLDAEVTRIKSLLERARELAAATGLVDELEFALQSIMRLHSSGRSRRGPAVEEEIRPTA